MRAEFGEEQVSEKKRQLMEQKKLVLVLDLDNTLLHSELFEVGRTFMPRGDRPGQRPKTIVCDKLCPIMRAMRRRM